MTRRLGVLLGMRPHSTRGALVLVSALAVAASPSLAASVLVWRVGTYRGIAGQFSTVQAAVNAARPGEVVNTNPAWLEVPIANPGNLECLHFPDPQTGQGQVRQPFPASGECPPLS